MRLALMFVLLVYGISMQTNGVNAIFWKFIKPFLNITISGSGSSSSSTNSTNSTSGSVGTSVSTGNLSNSNIIIGNNNSIQANITQMSMGSNDTDDTGNKADASSDSTTVADTTPAVSTPADTTPADTTPADTTAADATPPP